MAMKLVAQMFFVLSLLGSYVVVMSNQVNITATIPPGYALQDYLCSGTLMSNTAVVLDGGEHRMSSERPCNIPSGGNITISGSLMTTTTIRCEEGTVFAFILVQMVTMERITFINCGINLESIKHIFITNCTFKNSSIHPQSSYTNTVSITNCAFINNSGGAVLFYGSTGNIIIMNCRFENNSASVHTDGGGAVLLYGSVGTFTITNSTFKNNSAIYDDDGTGGGGGGGAVLLYDLTGNVTIINCIFQDNSAIHGGGDGGGGGGAVLLYESTGNFTITNSIFQNNCDNGIRGGGGAVLLYGSVGNVSITGCTFQNNSATTHDLNGVNIVGGAVLLYKLTGFVSIKSCTFQYSIATTDKYYIENASGGGGGGGAVFFYKSTGNVSITKCIFQYNNASTDYFFSGSDGGSGGAVFFYGPTGDISFINCTFQNNSANTEGGGSSGGGGGGAILLFGRIGNVTIKDCTFQNNLATQQSGRGNGGAVLLHESTGNVVITNCTFENNIGTNDDDIGGGGGAVLCYKSSSKVIITNCIFQNNRAAAVNYLVNGGSGGAVLFYGSTDDITITSCTFINNMAAYNGEFGAGSGGGGAVLLFQSSVNTIITNCTFQLNSATNNKSFGGGGGAVLLMGPSGNVTIAFCTFRDNSATNYDDGGGGGGAVHMFVPLGSVCITNCAFHNNSVTTGDYGGGGGAVLLNGLSWGVSITNCIFQNNNAVFGGAISIVSINSILISRSIFTKNTALGGAAIYTINSNVPMLGSDAQPLGHLTLQDVTVKDNHCSCNEYSDIKGGALYFNGMNVDINGNTTLGSQFSSNSPLGAIQGTNGFLQLSGNITFTNNTGINGGAISLSNSVPLYFKAKCVVEFSRNMATGFGGAIYSNGDQQKPLQSMKGSNDRCAMGLIVRCHRGGESLKLYCVCLENMFFITFIHNHAQQGGHAVYATPIYNCINCIGFYVDLMTFTGHELFNNLTSYFTITPLPEDIKDIQVLSFPKYVYLCGCNDHNLCSVTNQFEGKVITYPGRTVRLNVTIVDNGKNLSPGVVYTQIGDTYQKITFVPRQKAQWIGTVCGTLEYQIYGPEMASFKLLLSSYPTNFPTVIEVKLLPCEPGFTLISNSSTGLMMCGCSLFFTLHGVVCDTSDGTVTSNKTYWIGVYNNTDPALASTCPLEYCNSGINKLHLARPGRLCNGWRTGIVCGHCHGNYSVVFGSSKCQVCSDMWSITLVMFALLGVFLVAALFFFNLTITQGTLYGLIFYANIIQVNTSTFFSQSILKPLQVIVSFVNLDLGLPLCFYDGMDDADKAGLQFVFPAYLLILTMTVIVFCHYCLQRSHITSTRSCCNRFPIIIGERAVGVLSTLIYLSYSKLLRTVIDILTYSTVHLPSGDMYVWFYDGNVEYLRGKHAILFVVAMATCTIFLLPYTFALTFIPIIEQYSEHNRLFNYLQKKANQIKPMNDAHYAPYKGEWRWWLGARLWLVVVMYSLNPVYSSDKPSLLLSIQATMVILFTVAQASIKPFGQSHQKCNSRTNFYNHLYNSLDMFYLLNYTALAMSMSYILEQSSDQAKITVVAVGCSVGLYVVVLMVTVLYHLIAAILKICKMYDRAREKINGLFERKVEFLDPMELDATTNPSVDYGLWETQLED